MTATTYGKHLLSFLLIVFIVVFLFFLQSKDLYMMHHGSDLFYDIFNTKNEYNRRQTQYLSSSLRNYFDIYFGLI